MTLPNLIAAYNRAMDRLAQTAQPRIRQALRTQIRTLEARIAREKRLDMQTRQDRSGATI